MCDLLERFYESADCDEQVELARVLAQTVLAPVGGMWEEGEVLAFGDQEKGREAFRRLFPAPGRDQRTSTQSR